MAFDPARQSESDIGDNDVHNGFSALIVALPARTYPVQKNSIPHYKPPNMMKN
jgi:hypothetical protein